MSSMVWVGVEADALEHLMRTCSPVQRALSGFSLFSGLGMRSGNGCPHFCILFVHQIGRRVPDSAPLRSLIF